MLEDPVPYIEARASQEPRGARKLHAARTATFETPPDPRWHTTIVDHNSAACQGAKSRNLLAREMRQSRSASPRSEPATSDKRRAPIVDWVVGLSSAALLAMDIVMLVVRGRRPRRD